MIIKNLTINTQAGGKINCPGQLASHHCNQAYGTERQGIQLNLTCIITVTDATSYSDSLKRQGIQLNLTCIITVTDATSYSDSLKRQGIQLNLTCIITVTDATSYSDSLKRQGIQLNLTCIITVTDATSYSDSLKQVSLTINTQEGGKINRPGQLAPNKSLAPKFRSNIIYSLNDCRMILNSCCLAEKLQNVNKKNFPIFGRGKINRPGQLAPRG